MGYILPVNHYQYQDYQNRIKGIKINNKRTIGIDKVKKAYLFRSDALFAKQVPNDKQPRKKPSNNAPDKVYAQLTGIGRLFNESI